MQQVALISTFLSTCFANWQMLQLNLICFLATPHSAAHTHTQTHTRTTVTCMVNLISSIVVTLPPLRRSPSSPLPIISFVLCALFARCLPQIYCTAMLSIAVYVRVCVCVPSGCLRVYGSDLIAKSSRPSTAQLVSNFGLQLRLYLLPSVSPFVACKWHFHIICWCGKCVCQSESLSHYVCVCVCVSLWVYVYVSRNRTQIHFSSCCCTVKRDKKWCEYRRSRSVAMRSTAFGNVSPSFAAAHSHAPLPPSIHALPIVPYVSRVAALWRVVGCRYTCRCLEKYIANWWETIDNINNLTALIE